MFEVDEMMLYRGKDIKLTPQIIVTQPTIDQIIEFGERRYFSAVQTLTAVGADLKWQLWDAGEDYTKIDDYDLFVRLIFRMVSSQKELLEKMPNEERAKLTEEEKKEYLINPLQLILKDIDFANFVPMTHVQNKEIVLYDKAQDIMIGRMTYMRLVDTIRKMHGYKRNNETPANEKTKMDLIEDARDEYAANLNKPYKSVLLPLVSTLSVKSGQYGGDGIWNMKINRFFYDIKRVGKVQDATMLLQGAYSGFANLKGVDKTRLDIWGDL